jgi:hypothetical protein
MNFEQEKQLEQEIDRALKELPQLDAPPTLMRRVMQAVENRRSLHWYNQPWQYWPLGLRIAALTFLCLLFGGVCVASWHLTRAAGLTAAMQELGGTFSGVTTVWNIVTVLLNAIVLVVKHLGTGFMIGCLMVFALGYALCLGLGTAYVRLAFARR